MKYVLLVNETPEGLNRPADAEAVAAGRAYGQALFAAGVFVAGAGLEKPSATTTVTLKDGKRHVQDGPSAETKEYLAGFAIIDVPNLDVALEWAARHPNAGRAKIEVRPLLGFGFNPNAKQ
ncbi:MAG TPA: YciI family protein [Opitutaceae bacterium]